MAASADATPAAATHSRPDGSSLTLTALLARPGLHLRLLTAQGPQDPRLHTPLAWAHNSDLLDPAPWLSSGGLLLTDGVQFADTSQHSSAVADGYVARLHEAGVLALGFATEVVHAQVPPTLRQACQAHDLPLLEVGRRTPFMAVIKAVADARDAEERARLEWSLAAQRAIARSALRPDGLTSVLRELERRLDCWVMLFDAAGHRLPVTTTRHPDEAVLAEVEQAVRRVLHAGASVATRLPGADRAGANVAGANIAGAGTGGANTGGANTGGANTGGANTGGAKTGGARIAGARIAGHGVEITLQTLGRSGAPRGVLAVGASAPLERSGHDLVVSVIALASIALDQSRAIEEARRQLRSGLLELVLAGSLGVAGRSAARLAGPLPAAPVRVCLVETSGPPDALISELERLADRHRGEPFFAEQDERLVVIARHDRVEPLRELFGAVGASAGCSTPVTWKELRLGLDEARRAATRTGPSRPFARFEEIASDGMIGVLHSGGGAEVAAELLRPLLQRPAQERAELLDTVRVWLAQNCAWDPAARELNIHRHTLRSRIAHVATLIGLDLNRFGDRAELWAALECLDAPFRSPGSR